MPGRIETADRENAGERDQEHGPNTRPWRFGLEWSAPGCSTVTSHDAMLGWHGDP
jgi:hypothetical protein